MKSNGKVEAGAPGPKTQAEVGTEAMGCRRCGVCCTRHQAYARPEEIARIAAFLGISMADWLARYDDPRWRYGDYHLIRQTDGACAFLAYDEKGQAACVIYPARPACCADWIPGPKRKECRQGMRRQSGKRNRL